jgi:hypothetical protein
MFTPEGLRRRYGQGYLHSVTCNCYRLGSERKIVEKLKYMRIP